MYSFETTLKRKISRSKNAQVFDPSTNIEEYAPRQNQIICDGMESTGTQDQGQTNRLATTEWEKGGAQRLV